MDGPDGLLLHVSRKDYLTILSGLSDAANWLEHRPTVADADHATNQEMAAEYRRLFAALDGKT